MASLEEARIAALEAAQADYRAVLTAVRALGANQREYAARLIRVEGTLDDTNARVRSLEDGQSEIKDLLIRALDR